jgi:hypothetical protein
MVSVGDRITRDSGSDTNPESRHTVRRAVRTESGSPPLEGGGVWDWSRPNVCSRSGTCVEGGSAPSAPPVPAIPRAATLQECGRQLQLPGNSEVPNQGRRHRQSRNQGVEGSGREQASLYLLNKSEVVEHSCSRSKRGEEEFKASPGSAVLGSFLVPTILATLRFV